MTSDEHRDAEERPRDADFRDWLIFVALATVGTVVVVLAIPSPTMAGAAVSAALVVVLQIVYWMLARPSRAGIRDNSWRAWTYLAVSVVLFTVAVVLNPWASLALFALCPELFLMFRPTAAAIAVVAINAVPLVFRIALQSVSVPEVVQLIGTTVFIVAFSIFFSSRMTAVTAQSEERRRLIDELHEREAEVAALSAERGAGAERARIAREMHDTLAQGFTSIITLGHALESELDSDRDAARRHIALITETAQENLTESRRIIAALSPARLEDASLAEALQRLVAQFQAETAAGAEFVLDGAVLPTPAGVEVVLLRVAQECLANVRRHAGARHVDVMLSYADDAVALSVIDDGVGFDPDVVERAGAGGAMGERAGGATASAAGGAVGSASGGYGLRGMRARVDEAGGTLAVASRAGGGTSIHAVLPLPSAAEEETP